MTAPGAAPRTAPRTARERARAELSREIKEEARRQLAAVGADGLSLRAVARELGMVSSALYRYYPSRDDLLTALIIDAYDAIGEAAEAAAQVGQVAGEEAVATARTAADGARSEVGDDDGDGASARARWLAACHAIRAWALAHPHEYALIYGSPVPGYHAPEATIGPAARVPLTFITVLRDALAGGELAGQVGGGDGGVTHAGPAVGTDSFAGRHPVTGRLAGQADALSAALALEGAPKLPGDLLVRGVIAWTQLYGMLNFELFGQFVGSFEPADEFFAYAAAQLAAFVGLA